MFKMKKYDFFYKINKKYFQKWKFILKSENLSIELGGP